MSRLGISTQLRIGCGQQPLSGIVNFSTLFADSSIWFCANSHIDRIRAGGLHAVGLLDGLLGAYLKNGRIISAEFTGADIREDNRKRTGKLTRLPFPPAC